MFDCHLTTAIVISFRPFRPFLWSFVRLPAILPLQFVVRSFWLFWPSFSRRPSGLFCGSGHSGTVILGRHNFGRYSAHRPLLFLAASATNFDHRLAATTIYFALCPLGSTHLDCLHLFWPLPGHCGHSSATLVARSIVDAIRLFSSPSSPALFPYSITVFVCVSISRTTLFYTFVFPYLIPRLCLAYCERHLPHIVDSISRTLSSSLLDISHLRCRHASFFYFFSKGGRP